MVKRSYVRLWPFYCYVTILRMLFTHTLAHISKLLNSTTGQMVVCFATGKVTTG